MATKKTIDQQADDLVRKFRRTTEELDTDLKIALEKCAILVETDAVLLSAPVDTGLLSKSITHEVHSWYSGAKATVGTSCEYAEYVEFGTGIYADNGMGEKNGWFYKTPDGSWHHTMGMRPRHFLTNGLNQNKQNIDNLVAGAVTKVVNNAGR